MKRTLAVLLVAAAAAVGVVSAHGALRHPQSANSARASVKSVRQSARTAFNSAFAPGVIELAQNERLAVSSLKTAAASGRASIVAGQKGDSTCIYLTGGTHAVGGCAQLNGKALAPRIGIVDGGTYAWGLAAPSSANRPSASTLWVPETRFRRVEFATGPTGVVRARAQAALGTLRLWCAGCGGGDG
jgi:hypothetical protein